MSETDEAKIKTAVHAQRVRDDENRAERRQLNGSLRARSKGILTLLSIPRRRACVSGRGYVCILLSARFITANQGGTAIYSSLTEILFLCQGLFYAEKETYT